MSDCFKIISDSCNETLVFEVPENENLQVGIAIPADNIFAELSVKVIHTGANSASSVRIFAAAQNRAKIKIRTEFETKNYENVQAEQLTKILLLDDTCEASASPALETIGEGAKADHGAAIGGIPADKDFYLDTLALSDAEKSKLFRRAHLIQAFHNAPEKTLAELLNLL